MDAVPRLDVVFGTGDADSGGTRQGVELLERMEREWVPAASTLLDARRRDFLAPLWGNIARALNSAPFDPGNPKRHASRAYREGFDWERMRRSVVAVPGYESEPVLLARLAEAHWRLHDRANAIESKPPEPTLPANSPQYPTSAIASV